MVMQAPPHLKHNPPRRQRGGRPLAKATLDSFINARSIGYRGGISSPLSAPDACSRLSAYLAWGCISMLHVRGFAHLKKQPSSKALTPNNWDLIFEWPMKNPAEAGFSE
jgi:deoxyribodipyrimidine photolyase